MMFRVNGLGISQKKCKIQALGFGLFVRMRHLISISFYITLTIPKCIIFGKVCLLHSGPWVLSNLTWCLVSVGFKD